jgi:hypothetical protein
MSPEAPMVTIARRMIRLANRTTPCTCDVERVRWDPAQACAVIEHAAPCPLTGTMPPAELAGTPGPRFSE